jgi:transposase, IS6 family
MRSGRAIRRPVSCSAFAGFQFSPEVITLAVRWYLRFGRSYRDVEELLAERGIDVEHVTIYRWVQRFTPLLAEAARPSRRPVGDRWYVERHTSRLAAYGATSTGQSTSGVIRAPQTGDRRAYRSQDATPP